MKATMKAVAGGRGRPPSRAETATLAELKIATSAAVRARGKRSA